MLDLVEYLESFAAGPIVLLCDARPELLEARPSWARFPLFELGHLSDAETHELVGSLGVDGLRRCVTGSRRPPRGTRSSPSSSR